jgi:hypothetical protein
MSQAEYFSKPPPLFVKLADLLRQFPAVQSILARIGALLRGTKGRGEPRVGDFPPEAPAVTESTVVEAVAVAEPARAQVIAEPETNGRFERERLIRRRWAETGIKMWNPDVHGAGPAALNIQGGARLLPPKPGETLPRYDKLEFRMIRSDVSGQAANQIVCEGIVLDPPRRRGKN